MWQDILEPVTTKRLQLPREASTASVMGMVRSSFGAAGLYHLSLSHHQMVVSLVTITLFTPCIASLHGHDERARLPRGASGLGRHMGCCFCCRRIALASAAMISLEAKLRAEIRICLQCRNSIENPFAERCPRYLAVIPVTNPGCSRCIHNSACPATSLKNSPAKP